MLALLCIGAEQQKYNQLSRTAVKPSSSSGKALAADLVGEAVSCDHLLLPSLMGYLQSRSFLENGHAAVHYHCA